jgi:hypothetical protein
MDGTQFDQLIKGIAMQRVSRLTALRGLTVSAVAGLTGLSLVAEEADAKGKKRRKRKVCLCSPASCQTKKTRNRKKVIRANAPCAYGGACTSFNPCGGGTTTVAPGPGPECTTNTECTGGRVCVGGTCGNCTLTSQCNFNRVCLGTPGLCVGREACTGTGSQPECTNIHPVLNVCVNGGCQLFDACTLNFQCNTAQGEFCLLGECVRNCGPSLPACSAGADCIAGVCISVSMISDRAVKANLASVDPVDMLARVRELPIATWNYTSDDSAIRHIGPMAQDFATAFGVGADDHHIHPIDGHGVALAAIQGLAAELERLRAENAALAARVVDLEQAPGAS